MDAIQVMRFKTMQSESTMITGSSAKQMQGGRARARANEKLRFFLKRLNDNSRIVHPRTLHVERDHLRYRHEVLTTKRTAQQPKRQILLLTILLLLALLGLGLDRGTRPTGSLSDASRPIGHHVRAARTVVQLAETVRGEYEERAWAEASVDYVRFGRDVRWSSVSGEEGLPGRWVCHAWVQIVEYATGEDGRLLKGCVSDA